MCCSGYKSKPKMWSLHFKTMYMYLLHRLVFAVQSHYDFKGCILKSWFYIYFRHSMKIEILKMNIWNKQDSSQPGEISCKVAHLVLLRDVEQVSVWQMGFTQLGGQVTDHCVSFIYKVQSWTETHYLNQYNFLNREGGWLCLLFPYSNEFTVLTFT